MSAAENKPKKKRIVEDNNETMEADDGKMKPQLSFSELLCLAEIGKDKKIGAGKSDEEMGAVSAAATNTITRLHERCTQFISTIHERKGLHVTEQRGLQFNENVVGCMAGRTQTLDQVMEALVDPDTHIIGIYFSNENAIKVTASLLQRVARRAQRDNMFDVTLQATITNTPDIKKIQSEIADGLNLKVEIG